jgi:hypothetical protein
MHNIIVHMLCSAIAGGIIDRAIEAEDRKHGDFMKIVSCLLLYCLLISMGVMMLLMFSF